MKSRRVLQIIVAVLSIITLACVALLTVSLVGAKHLDVTPQPIVDFTETFGDGLKAIADQYSLPEIVVPAVALGAPALLLLLAIILILSKNNGKDGKNIVGCVFALIGVAILAAFMMFFAKKLFAESQLVIDFGASGGLLALFIIFVGAALGVKPKRIVVADESTETVEDELEPVEGVAVEDEPVEESEEYTEAIAEDDGEFDVEPLETVESESELEDETDAEGIEELKSLDAELERLDKELDEKLGITETPAEEPAEETPATQYVPQRDVSIHDVVERTYGKDSDGLTRSTIEKINKVRALYELRAITEEEYLKLVRKYLGF